LDLPELSGKFAGQTLVAARYDIVTAADNRVSVVTNEVAALPGLPASGPTENPAS
jgi:hypothetical protein